MTNPTDSVATQLDQVISDYLLACEAGTAPSLDTLYEKHPDFADGIREYFHEKDQLASSLQMPTVDAIQIDGYEMVKEIGRGGMGVVFEARQLSLGRSVAIKVLRDAALSSPSMRARFDKEAQLIAKLKHDDIVDVIEFGRVDDRPFLVMPLLEGQPLSRSISKEPLSEKAAAKIMLTVADAVQFAHSQGVIHRDIKPGNIMGDGERCQVMDFGLAFAEGSDQRLTGTGDVIGTPGFLAPEIIRGQSRGDVATDVYALGATLYSLLVGQSPHRAATVAESMMLAMQGEPVEPKQFNATLSTDINSIAMKCLQASPKNRYQSAKELQDDLQRLADGKAVAARPIGALGRFTRWANRNRILAATGAIAALLLVGLLAGGAYSYVRISDSLDKQQILTEKQTELTEKQTELTAKSNHSLRKRLDAIQSFYTKLAASPKIFDTPETMKVREEFMNQGIRFLEDFAEENRDNPDLQIELAKSHRTLGDLHGRLGNAEDQTNELNVAIAILETLDTSKYTVAQLRTQSLLSLAVNQRSAGHLNDANTTSEKAIEVSRPLAAVEQESPELCLTHFAAIFELQRSLEQQRKTTPELFVTAQQALEGIDRIADNNPNSAGLQYRAAQFHNWYAIMEIRRSTGKDRAHVKHWRTATEYATAAVKLEPDNETYQRQQRMSNGNLVFTARLEGKVTQELIDMNADVLQVVERLAKANPANVRRQLDYAEILQHTAALEFMVNDATAEQRMQSAIEKCEQLTEEITAKRDPSVWTKTKGIHAAAFETLAQEAKTQNDAELYIRNRESYLAILMDVHEAFPNDRKTIEAIGKGYRQTGGQCAKFDRHKKAMALFANCFELYERVAIKTRVDFESFAVSLRLTLQRIPEEIRPDLETLTSYEAMLDKAAPSFPGLAELPDLKQVKDKLEELRKK